MSIHINAKKEDIAKVVLMSGDPLRVKYIAENYLEDYKLVSNVRNMLGYTGFYKGKRVTIMSHGMGIPSCGIYSYELYNDYDVDTIIRLGTAGSYTKELNLNDLVLVTESYSDSTYGKNLNNYSEDIVSPSVDINNKLIELSKEQGITLNNVRVYSTDNFYTKDDISNIMREEYKCSAVEMESFALFYNAKFFNKKCACLLTISDSLITNDQLSSEERENGLNKMISLGLDSILKI